MASEKQFFMRSLGVLLLCGPAIAWAEDSAVVADNRPVIAESTVQELVDPTRPVAFVAPVGQQPKTERKPQLQAIYFGDDRREAVINGRTVKVGDVVDQAKILAIGPGRVRYTKNGKEVELVLLPRVLQPVRGEN